MFLRTLVVKHKVKTSEVLHKACPNCGKGDLVHKFHKRWFTFLSIPLIPLDVLDKFYECNICENAYNEEIRNILSQPKEDILQNKHKVKLIYAKALVAAMTHMALIDQDYDTTEEKEILSIISKYSDLKHVLEMVHMKVKTQGNHDNYVFKLLREAKEILSSEALVKILAQAALVLLADGKKDFNERQLMKEYVRACGLPTEMHRHIISKVAEGNLL